MLTETPSTPDVAPQRWIRSLSLAAIAVMMLTGGIFYFTTRSIFNRKDISQTPPIDPMVNVVSLEHGLAVYSKNCAMCHGPSGLGDGPSAEPLNPKPRDFSSGSFKLGTTRTGLPTDDDLAATIRHGMLPAAMPPWPQFTEGELKSVVMAVRHLAVEGRVAGRLARSAAYPRDKAVADAHAQLDSGPPIQLPPAPAKFDLLRGKELYMNNCAACHDPDGRGKLRQDLVDNSENPILPRDLTSGQFKGGSSVADIAVRITRGIPGTPMPANPDLNAADLWSVAAYVKAFSQGNETTANAKPNQLSR